MTALTILCVLAALLILVLISIYNGLVRKKNEVENAFGSVDVQLKKRYDLIPNLVAAVKQYASHEKELLENITNLRTQAMDGKLSGNEKVNVDNKISKALGNIMVAVENYPQLKANEGFNNLQRSLNEVESQISAARRAYNAAVTDYNNGIETFPNNLVARKMSYARKAVFEIPETERGNVNVGNLFN